MGVRLRNGSLHYRFKRNGKEYSGNCETLDMDVALAFERKQKDMLEQAGKLRNKPAVLRKFIESEIETLRLKLDDVFVYFESKPRSKRMTAKNREEKLGVWSDWLKWLKRYYPLVVYVNDVEKYHAEQYIDFIQKNGRYEKVVSYVGRTGKVVSYRSSGKLSDRSCNKYLIVLREIVGKVQTDCGIDVNPFADIPMLDEVNENRIPFSDDELALIFESGNAFVVDLFTLILYTGLREGDACTLKWPEVSMGENTVTRKFMKTGFVGVIPVLPPLELFLEDKRSKSEYVLPEHARIYLSDRREVGRRVKRLLNELGIKNTVKAASGNNVSVKDVHSLRHNFCYKALQARMPLAVLMSIVGHTAIEMSLHYQKHVEAEEARKWMNKMKFGLF